MILRLILALCLLSASLAYAESSIWKLDSDHYQFYIAGSFHALRKTDYPLPQEFEYAYRQSNTILFETFLDELETKQNKKLLSSKGLYKPGDSLDKHLSKSSYARLIKYCHSNNIPITSLNSMKPWLIALSFAFVELKKHGINPENGIDTYFFKKAKQDLKKTSGLVPVSEHIEIISSIGKHHEDLLIENFLDEVETIAPILDELISAWRKGDKNKLNKLVNLPMKESTPVIYKNLMTDRNKHWIKPIEKLIKSKQNTMIIVGVGHLVGKDNVIQLLAKKGYKFKKFDIKKPN